MKKISVVFVKENNTEVCKRKSMSLFELSKIIAKYEVYMMGTTFIITKDYDKIKTEEVKPTEFGERIGVSQTVMMYNDLVRRIYDGKEK